MAYGGFKNLTRRTTSDKILRDTMFYKFFDKKSSGSGRPLSSTS